MKIVHVQSMATYRPPYGWRIFQINQLLDGSYEVTLEPLAWFL